MDMVFAPFGALLGLLFLVVPLAVAIYALVLLNRTATGIERLEATVDRRLAAIEQRMPGPGSEPTAT